MSQEDVELVRSVIEGWNRAGNAGVVSLLSADWVGHPFPEWPSDPIYHGRAGFEKLSDEWTETFDEVTWAIERLVGAEGSVVALVHHQGLIRGAGVPMSQPIGAVFTSFTDGTVGEISFFITWAEALEAAGVRE